jgi:hypothetical protein
LILADSLTTGSSAAKLPPGKGRERVGVAHDGNRLVERADQVLAERVIHTRLAANRGVDLREQRRGQLHAGDAAQVCRGRESGHVANHAAAERDERRAAIGLRLDEPVVDAGRCRQRLVLLAVGDEDRRLAAQRCGQCRAVQTPHGGRRHDESAGRRGRVAIEQRVERRQQARAYENRARAAARAQVQLLHGCYHSSSRDERS